MKINVIKLFLIFSGFSFMLMTACQKFVNQEPVSEISSGRFWETEADVQSGVAAIYDGLQETLNSNYWLWGESRSDDFRPKPNDQDILDLTGNSITADIGCSDWTDLYKIISRANLAIKNIPNVKFNDDEVKNNYLGQAYTLRAMAYFYGIRVWGAIPMITEPYTKLSEKIYVSRTSADSIMQQIILPDLEKADTLLSPNIQSVYEISLGGLYALETNVAMWNHDYVAADSASARLINLGWYTLVKDTASWDKIFTVDDNPSSESIFTLHWNYVEDGSNDMNTMVSYGNARVRPSDKFMASFEHGDMRQWYIYDTTEATPTQNWKYLGIGLHDVPSDVSETDYPIYRLSGILLLRAEALNHLDHKQEAVDLLNKIRVRALLPPKQVSDFPTTESLETAILHERQIELYLEGKRWFDLLRTGRAIKVMKPINGMDNPDDLLFPIYYQNIIVNPNLIQNPGY